MVNFDEKALTWDDEPRRFERAKPVAAEIIKAIPDLSRKSGLEYGCGTGILSFYLQPYLRQIILGDNSDGMLAVLKRKIENQGIENMRPLKVDLAIEQVPEFQVDLVYTLMVMHHIENIERVIRGFFQMLKPQGYVCIADLVAEDGSFHGAGFSGHHGFNESQLARKLESCGFNNVGSKICFEVIKESDTGQPKKYPLFFMIGQK